MAVSLSAETPKVLLVHHEKVIPDTYAIILRQCGFEAVPADSVDEAIETAKTFRPDVLLVEVVMPRMTGIETAIVIRGFLPDCYVIATSGSIGAWDLLEKARDEGHDIDFIATPIHPQELLLKLSGLFPNFMLSHPIPPMPSDTEKPGSTGKSSVPPRARSFSSIRQRVAGFFSR
jgi:CheY-like chemotaxis protein